MKELDVVRARALAAIQSGALDEMYRAALVLEAVWRLEFLLLLARA